MDYRQLADSIPSMGGRQIGHIFDKYIKYLKPDRAIIELGTWLGAGTAQMALSVINHNKNSKIYTYDKFIVSGRQPLKAQKEGWRLSQGENVYSKVCETLSLFPVPISVIQGIITDAVYSGEKIGLYVDDALKQPGRFEKGLEIFSPYFIPGETIIILMDYYLWEKRGSEHHKHQYNFIHSHSDCFKMIDDRIDSTYIPAEGKDEGAAFLYLGGLF